MPVKRRADKRRVDPEREFVIWKSILTCGCDWFGELPELGLAPEDGRRRPPEAEAREAWARLGRRILAERKADEKAPWAEEKFGRPWETTDAS